MTDEPTRMDNPNQQAVRPDGSGPADEGTGAGKPSRASRERPRDTDDAGTERRPVGRPRTRTPETTDNPDDA
jgi:hypothetical protein